MSTEAVDSLTEQVLRLPYEKRVELYEKLGETLGPHPKAEDLGEAEHREAWSAELTKRMAASDAGEPGVPAEEVFAKFGGAGDGRPAG